jgi:rhamnosyltransferase
MDMKILVFIPTLNAQKFIKKQIDLLRKQTQKVDIFVVDSGSEDNTLQIIRECGVDYIQIKKTEFNHGLTRNMVLNFSGYDYYLFLTQDAIPCDEKLVENMLKYFSKDVKIVYARQVPYEFSNDIEKYSRMFNYPEKTQIKDKNSINELGIKTFFTSNSCCMYEVEYFKKQGGFVDTNVSEDMEFAYRCVMDGYKIVYAADAKICHSHVYSFKSLYKRYFEIGRFFCYHKKLSIFDSKKEGALQVRYVLLNLIKNRRFFLVFRYMAEIIVKYIAFKKGLKGC